ncbi:MAG: hypothetical protein HDT02_03655 [Bacteroidales bacterium]|nr:hypothetical protein [Bacteroidales bacterium]
MKSFAPQFPENYNDISPISNGNLSLKDKVLYSLAVLLVLASVICIFLGLFLEPRGEIHPSVLTYFGLSCSFAAGLLGISLKCDNEIARIKSSLNIHH